jgi:hypothetical protein
MAFGATAGEIIQDIRMRNNLMSKNTVSDHEILIDLNSILQLLVSIIARLGSDYLTKFVELNLVQDPDDDKMYVADMPDDFLSVIDVRRNKDILDGSLVSQTVVTQNGYVFTTKANSLKAVVDYRIVNNKLYTKEKTLYLLYRFNLDKPTMNTFIELPYNCLEVLKKFTGMVITKQIAKTDSTLNDLIFKDLTEIVASRELGAMARPLPFVC